MNSKNMHELHWLNISEAAAAIAARELSPVDLVEALLERIEALDAQINAFITVTAEQALNHAVNADALVKSLMDAFVLEGHVAAAVRIGHAVREKQDVVPRLQFDLASNIIHAVEHPQRHAGDVSRDNFR